MYIQMHGAKMFLVPAFDPTGGLKNEVSKQMSQYQFYEPDNVHVKVRLKQ